MSPRWEEGALVADLPAGTWEVRVEVTLGGLRHAWTVSHTAVAGRTSVVDLAVQSGAWLDDLAATYVTDLVVKLTGTTDAARGLVVLAPPAFLVWPSGPAGAAEVWDLATQVREAPLGVLDDAVRSGALATGASPTRILPPLVRVPVTRTEEE